MGRRLTKIIPIIITLIVLVAVGLVASTFFDNQNLKSLQLEQTSGTTYVEGKEQQIAVTGNVGNLTCSTSNTEFANCRIEENTLIIVPGTKTGEATITVFDENSASIDYVVTNTVKETSLSLSSLTGTTTAGGSTIKIDIKGENYGKLTCTSSNTKIATCSISGTTLTVTPKSTTGKATITVKEDLENKKVQYILTVNKKTTVETKPVVSETVSLSLSKTKGTTTSGGSVLTAIISGKNYGTLTCSSSNTKVAKCTISGTKLTITPVEKGTAVITVKESKKSKTVKYTATVEGVVSFSLSNSSVTTYAGSELKETITGKNYGTLSCSTSNKDIATCTIDGSTLKINAKSKGNATITVKASNTSKTLTYAVKVEEKSALRVSLSLSSTSGVTYTGGSNLNVTISGKDFGQLTCKTTNSDVATCKISGTTLVVTPGKTSGTASIIVQESNRNLYVTYKVTNKNVTLSLSSTSGVAYIGSSSVSVTIKGSNYGTLSCESADEEIATCQLTLSRLVITPGTKAGTTIIILKENGQNKYVEFTINVIDQGDYKCTTGILVEDSAKGGAICITDASIKEDYVCTESEKTSSLYYFCNDVYVSNDFFDGTVSCSTEKYNGPVEAAGQVYNCNNQYFCSLIQIEEKCITGVYKDVYYCPSGWKTYEGANETLTCYKKASYR